MWCSGGCSWKCYKTLTFCSLLTTPLWREAHFKSKCTKHITMLRPLLEVEKSARRCGAKHISKSKFTQHTIVGPLLELEMSKKVYAVVARSTFRNQNLKNTRGSDHFWRFRCRFEWQAQGIVHPSTSSGESPVTSGLSFFLGLCCCSTWSQEPSEKSDTSELDSDEELSTTCSWTGESSTFFILFRHLNFQKWSDAGVFCTC